MKAFLWSELRGRTLCSSNDITLHSAVSMNSDGDTYSLGGIDGDDVCVLWHRISGVTRVSVLYMDAMSGHRIFDVEVEADRVVVLGTTIEVNRHASGSFVAASLKIAGLVQQGVL